VKVLLIASSRENLPYHVAPIGVGYLAASLVQEGFEVSVLDLSLEREAAPLIRARISEFSPDVIGISIRNLDVVTYPSDAFVLPLVRKITNTIKRYSSAPIVLGGSGFSLLPVETLRYLDVNLGIVGEGEHAFPQLLRSIEAGTDMTVVPGLVALMEDGQVLQNSPWRVADLDALPFPAREMMPSAGYVAANIQTKRGCAFSCSYCTYPLLEGKLLRKRSPRKVVDEMEVMVNRFGIHRLDIVDNVFNVPVAHASEICREIIRRELPIEWTASVRPDYLPLELVTLMKRAGCIRLDIGTDAASEPTLIGLSKGFSFDEIREGAAVCREVDMPFSCYLILGAPGETDESVRATLENMEEIDPPSLLGLTGVRVYPGTPIAEQAIRESAFEEPIDWLNRPYYITPAARDNLFSIIREFTARHPNWCFPGLGENVNPKDFQAMMDYVSIPDWESTDTVEAQSRLEVSHAG
jgi:radical SAM superfamily enzyme YgiQ (UPF0313 family)